MKLAQWNLAHEVGNGAARASWGKKAAYQPQGFKYPNSAEAIASLGCPSAQWTYFIPLMGRSFMVLRFDHDDGAKSYRVITEYRGGWYVDLPEQPYYLYQKHFFVDSPVVYVCEGEKAADAARTIRLPVTTSLGGPTQAALTNWLPTQGKEVVILRDFDEAGQKYAEEVAQLCLNARAKSVKIVTLPGLQEGEDLVEWIGDRECETEEGKTLLREEIKAIAAAAPLVELKRKEVSAVDSAEPEAELCRMSEVSSRPVEWVLEGVVPRGKLTLLAGESGVGKSLLVADMVARVTRGRDKTDEERDSGTAGLMAGELETRGRGTGEGPGILGRMGTDAGSVGHVGGGHVGGGKVPALGSVLLLAPRGDVADTIRPRLEAAGAEASLIYALSCVRQTDPDTGESVSLPFRLERDLPVLEAQLARLNQGDVPVKMVVIDPVDDFFAANHRAWEVRAVAAALSDLAARANVAIVVVARLPQSRSAMAGLLGTRRSVIAPVFAEAAKSVWLVGADSDDATRRLLLPVKTNLCALPPARAGSIVNDGVRWEDNTVALTAAEYLAQAKQRRPPAELDDRSEVARAVAWLKERLWIEAVHSKQLTNEAREQGISYASLRRGFHWLRGKAVKEQVTGMWLWTLPKEERGPTVEVGKARNAESSKGMCALPGYRSDQDAQLAQRVQDALLALDEMTPNQIEARRKLMRR